MDLGALNKCIIRPRFDSQIPFQAVRTIPPGMKFFIVVDALKGYHQVPLDEESAAMTSFLTPIGPYQYLRFPFGVVHAGDDYCRRVADISDDIPNSRRVDEDILVFSKTGPEHVEAVRHLFARAVEHDVPLNTKKVQFAQQTAKFGGYVVTENHFKPDPELTDAIRKFPTPKNSTDFRAFFGLCQEVGNFSNRVATALGPLPPPEERVAMGEDHYPLVRLHYCQVGAVRYRRANILRPGTSHCPACGRFSCTCRASDSFTRR